MQKIILDTNFLLIPAQFGVDIFSEISKLMGCNYKLCIIDATLDELENIIEKQRGKDKAAAKMALQLLKTQNIDVLKTEKNLNADELIVNLVKERKFTVATQDQGLKRKLKQYNVPLIVLRQKKYLKLI